MNDKQTNKIEDSQQRFCDKREIHSSFQHHPLISVQSSDLHEGAVKIISHINVNKRRKRTSCQGEPEKRFLSNKTLNKMSILINITNTRWKIEKQNSSL